MRTVVIDGPASIRVDTRPDPALTGPDGVIVAVRAAGICGSDLHFYEGDYPLAEPVPLGHEAVGTIVEAARRCDPSRSVTKFWCPRWPGAAGVRGAPPMTR